jgi:hypothetical protein
LAPALCRPPRTRFAPISCRVMASYRMLTGCGGMTRHALPPIVRRVAAPRLHPAPDYLRLTFAFETVADRPALERLAKRLEIAGADVMDWPLRFSWNQLPGAGAADGAFPVSRRRLLAWDGDEVRGAVNFFEHELFLARSPEPIAFAWSNGLFSESVIDRRYSSTPIALMRVALARQPRQMTVGPIGTDAPFPRLLIALGWSHQPVSVLVLPIRTAVVTHELRRLSQYPKLRAIGRAAAAIGLASLADLGFAGLRRLGRARDTRIKEVGSFAGWSDAVWRASQPHYGALARRDGLALDRLYRPGDWRLIRLKVSGAGRSPLGWIAVTVRENVDDPNYGGLRLGVLADCLAPPEDAGTVVAAAVEWLAAARVDLIKATFSHKAWIAAAKRIGFMPVQTTTRLFASPSLATALPPLRSVHLTLGDNDGPLSYDKAVEEETAGEVADQSPVVCGDAEHPRQCSD